LFTSIENLTIVTPSNWLASIVKQSFLSDKRVEVINNGIDLTVFKPTSSNFIEKYCLQNKKIVLGVAFDWGARKGLDVFIELSKLLDNTYQIVLVGTNSQVDKQLPSNIISIHQTNNQTELAEIYSVADVFVNPTREDTFPTVNIESLACGTPIVTFNTGGSPEIIDETCGVVVNKNDVVGMKNAIINVCENNLFSVESCVNRAKNYDMYDKFNEYVTLYCNGSV
jgi:glycosyltransferase involved in cell wall biosynthesis